MKLNMPDTQSKLWMRKVLVKSAMYLFGKQVAL